MVSARVRAGDIHIPLQHRIQLVLDRHRPRPPREQILAGPSQPLAPARDPATGYRVFRASDTRDAGLAHLLRRGGHPLDHVATVVQQVRTAGGTETLSRALDDWRRRPTAQGVAMLDAAARLSHYLSLAANISVRSHQHKAGQHEECDTAHPRPRRTG